MSKGRPQGLPSWEDDDGADDKHDAASKGKPQGLPSFDDVIVKPAEVRRKSSAPVITSPLAAGHRDHDGLIASGKSPIAVSAASKDSAFLDRYAVSRGSFSEQFQDLQEQIESRRARTYQDRVVDLTTPATTATSLDFLEEWEVALVQRGAAALRQQHAVELAAVMAELQSQLDDHGAELVAMREVISEKDRHIRSKESELSAVVNSGKSKDAKIKQLELDVAHAVALKRSSEAAAAALTKQLAESESKAGEAGRQAAAALKAAEARHDAAKATAKALQEQLGAQAREYQELMARLQEDSKGTEARLNAVIAALEVKVGKLENEIDGVTAQLRDATAAAAAVQASYNRMATIKYEGVLSKMGGRWKAWKKRQFALHGAVLQYFEGDALKGCIALLPRSVIVLETDDPEASTMFHVSVAMTMVDG